VSLRDVKEKAAKLIATSQYQRAEVLLRQVLTQSPRDSATWLKHAEVLKRLARPVDAVASYRLAARLLDEDGYHSRAAVALKLALRLLPEDVDLIADIIRSEMKARRPGSVRQLFPLSSPSGLLDASISPDEPRPSSPSSLARVTEAPPALLALPMAPFGAPEQVAEPERAPQTFHDVAASIDALLAEAPPRKSPPSPQPAAEGDGQLTVERPALEEPGPSAGDAEVSAGSTAGNAWEWPSEPAAGHEPSSRAAPERLREQPNAGSGTTGALNAAEASASFEIDDGGEEGASGDTAAREEHDSNDEGLKRDSDERPRDADGPNTQVSSAQPAPSREQPSSSGETHDRWPRVLRRSPTEVSIQGSAWARWVTVRSSAPLEVDVTDDAPGENEPDAP
jgi:hypothetical protein